VTKVTYFVIIEILLVTIVFIKLTFIISQEDTW